MNKEEKIKELEETIKKAQEQLEELKVMKDSKAWKPNQLGTYYYMTNDGELMSSYWNGCRVDQNRYLIGNCYKTAEAVKEAIEIKKIDTELRRYALEHNEEDIDWSNEEQTKYYICIAGTSNELDIDWTRICKEPGQIYFTSEEIAKYAIGAIGKDRVEKWCKYE